MFIGIQKFSRWCFVATNESGNVIRARHYAFLINTFLLNYAFGCTPMGTIICTSMYLNRLQKFLSFSRRSLSAWAFLNLWDIFRAWQKECLAIRFINLKHQLSHERINCSRRRDCYSISISGSIQLFAAYIFSTFLYPSFISQRCYSASNAADE